MRRIFLFSSWTDRDATTLFSHKTSNTLASKPEKCDAASANRLTLVDARGPARPPNNAHNDSSAVACVEPYNPGAAWLVYNAV